MTFDPYHKWLAIPPRDQPPNHYRLLGVELFESDLDVITHAADQRMGHVHIFGSKYPTLSQKILNEIAAAKVCLLNPQKKKQYDDWIREVSPVVRKKKQFSRQISAAVIGAVILIVVAVVLFWMTEIEQCPRVKKAAPAQPIEPKEPEPQVSIEPKEPEPQVSIEPKEPEPQVSIEPKEPEPQVSIEPKEPEETLEEVSRDIFNQYDQCHTPNDYETIIQQGLVTSDKAIIKGKIKLAKQLVTLCLKAARKTNNVEVIREATRRWLELQNSDEAEKAARMRSTQQHRQLGDLLER